MAETALEQLRRLRKRSRIRSTGRWIANHTGVWLVLGGTIALAVVASVVGYLVLTELLGWKVSESSTITHTIDARALVSLVAASIALAALVASIYGHYRSVRTSDVMLWQACHERIGELYDMAMDDREISAVLSRKADFEARYSGDDRPIVPSDRLHQWLINYLMALEQSVVCLEIMRPSSRRAWQKHIEQQIANPVLRAAFFDDNLQFALDNHHPDRSGSWSEDLTRLAVRALPQKLVSQWTERTDRPLQTVAAGHGLWRFLQAELGFRMQPTKATQDLPPGLIVVQLKASDVAQRDRWQRPLFELLGADDVRRQMFPVVDDWNEIAADYRYVVSHGESGDLVATFSLEVDGLIAEIGFAIHPRFRDRRLARSVVAFSCAEARRLGVRTLRANVFVDNARSIATLKAADFREFVWMERNA